jgi:hypothetical protein
MDRVVGHGAPAGERQRALGRRHPGAVLEVLHADRHAGQRPGIAPRRHRGVHRLGRGVRQPLVEVDERAQPIVARCDRGQRVGQDVDRLPLAAPHRLGDPDDRLAHSHPLVVASGA